MTMEVIPFATEHVLFVHDVFLQNIEVLHGASISQAEWEQCLIVDPDPFERNVIFTADGKNAAWMKLNGRNKPLPCISMLVVAKEYQHKGVGSFALQHAEQYASSHGKSGLVVQTTKDNFSAVDFYLKHGYEIEKEIRYAVGDGVPRDGYQFVKSLEGDR